MSRLQMHAHLYAQDAAFPFLSSFLLLSGELCLIQMYKVMLIFKLKHSHTVKDKILLCYTKTAETL